MSTDDRSDEQDASSERVFVMDPDATLRQLARNLVAGQQTLATMSRTAATLRAHDAPPTPETELLLADFDRTQTQWHTEVLPSLAASMKLACEVYDTFGSGTTTVEDPTDAAIWNNKYLAWEWELSGRPSQ